jgi:hypothetical protein
MANPGHCLAAHLMANTLKGNGINPAPQRKRKTAWKEFLSPHAKQIVATDFFAIKVWTKKGLFVLHRSRFPACSTRRSRESVQSLNANCSVLGSSPDLGRLNADSTPKGRRRWARIHCIRVLDPTGYATLKVRLRASLSGIPELKDAKLKRLKTRIEFADKKPAGVK